MLTRILEINFGREYGYLKVKVNEHIAIGIIYNLNEVKNYYNTNFSETTTFEYNTVTNFNIQNYRILEFGKLTIMINGKRITQNDLRDNRKHPSAIDVFFMFSPSSRIAF